MPGEKYKPNIEVGSRVRFDGKAHDRRNGQSCTILLALPNPSQRPENQWYDVRFDDYGHGRFQERFLHAESSGESSNVG